MVLEKHRHTRRLSIIGFEEINPLDLVAGEVIGHGETAAPQMHMFQPPRVCVDRWPFVIAEEVRCVPQFAW